MLYHSYNSYYRRLLVEDVNKARNIIMASLDSGIKLDQSAVEAIGGLEKSKYAFIILQIGVPEGGKVEKVYFKEGLSKAECQDLVNSDSDTYKLRGEESPTWCVFRTRLSMYTCAYGSAYIHYTTVDGYNRQADKLMFVLWTTGDAATKDRMKYASTKVMTKFGITPTKVQTSDTDDLPYLEIVNGKLGRKESRLH